MTRSKPVQLVLAQNDTTVLQTKDVDIRVSKSTSAVPSGIQWGLTHFQTRGPDVVEVKSDRDPGYLFSLVRLSGAFGIELDHGVTYDDASTGLTRPWKADARFQFFTDDSEIFTTLAPYDVVGQWFGDRLPKELQGLMCLSKRETIHRPCATPAHVLSALRGALLSPSPVRPRLVEASAMQLMAHRIEYFCRAEQRAVSLREAQAARDAHDFMCRHLQRSPTVAEIAVVCRIPARRLELAYRDVFGVSLYNNMVALRFEAMCAALREGVPVKQVAHQFGYANPSNFTYAFRKKMGMPPRQWLQHIGRR